MNTALKAAEYFNDYEKQMEENDFASIWLEETGNPAIEELAQLNVDVAGKTAKTLTDKGISANDLAVSLDINPDEVHRWLTGRHTFSIKIIQEISDILIDYSTK